MIHFADRMRLAHRVSYEQLVAPVAPGLELDHLCRNRYCCNPLHLEPVDHLTNVRRGNAGKLGREQTHCKHGHEFTAENTLRDSKGRRACRICRQLASARYEKVRVRR